MMRLLISFCYFWLQGFLLFAQDQSSDLKSLLPAISDIDIRITDQHINDDSEIRFVYFQQYYLNRPIIQATGLVAFNASDTIRKTEKLLMNPALQKNTKYQSYAIDKILLAATRHLNIPITKSSYRLASIPDQHALEIDQLVYARGSVRIQESWMLQDQELIPVAQMEIPSAISPDRWSLTISVEDYRIIDETNFTVYCHIHNAYEDTESIDHSTHRLVSALEKNNAPSSNDKAISAKYRVFAYPDESPNHGQRSLVSSPEDPIASTYGWHDTNGVTGPESTLTFGNNVRAYKDEDNDDLPDDGVPDGDSLLIFDFPFSADSSLQHNLDADITNLFYWNNFIHDWSYRFGFNEASGNFQFNNYGRGGIADDAVEAQTLDGGDTGNANFSAPRDGTPGRMQMYRWLGGSAINVSAKDGVNNIFNTGAANFGPPIRELINGKLVIAIDNVGNSTDICEPIINASDISGNIAIIDRGTCHFSAKVFKAQQAGAKACVICNIIPDGGIVSMSAGDDASRVTIPSVFITKEDCDIIKAYIDQDLQPSVTFNPIKEISSAFDNGIVVHEYGHGISLRLVGGANNSGCLSNDEQLGEGWSDFFSLVLTQKPEDSREKGRGIGTYALGEKTTARGIRRHVYSTDMQLNRQTHAHIRATARPHPLGEVWAVTLWDLYWDMIDLYGYDPTWRDRESGNFKAIQLVIDGMKIQGCNVGILEARDAILTADILNYSGENRCTIWQAFARRGMGADADQGRSNNRSDNIEGFDIPGDCSRSVLVYSELPSFAQTQDTIVVRYELTNYTGQPLTNNVINIDLPEGLRFIEMLSTQIPIVNGNNIRLSIGNVSEQIPVIIQFKASIHADGGGTFFNENFDGATIFVAENTNDNTKSWSIQEDDTLKIRVFNVPGDTLMGESFLRYPKNMLISPLNNLFVLRHKYNTQLGIDGGRLQLSTNNGLDWIDIPSSSIKRNSYPDFLTFDILYNQTIPSFTGTQDWTNTVIDLSAYMNQEIQFRFNYTQQQLLEFPKTQGWSIDYVSFLGKRELPISFSLGHDGMILAEKKDTFYVLAKDISTSTTEASLANDPSLLILSPVPAGEYMDVHWSTETAQRIQLVIYDMQGRMMFQQLLENQAGKRSYAVPTIHLLPGSYILQWTDGKTRSTKAFLKI